MELFVKITSRRLGPGKPEDEMAAATRTRFREEVPAEQSRKASGEREPESDAADAIAIVNHTISQQDYFIRNVIY